MHDQLSSQITTDHRYIVQLVVIVVVDSLEMKTSRKQVVEDVQKWGILQCYMPSTTDGEPKPKCTVFSHFCHFPL